MANDLINTNDFAGSAEEEAQDIYRSCELTDASTYPVTQALLAVAEELRLTRAVLERLVSAVEMLEATR